MSKNTKNKKFNFTETRSLLPTMLTTGSARTTRIDKSPNHFIDAFKKNQPLIPSKYIDSQQKENIDSNMNNISEFIMQLLDKLEQNENDKEKLKECNKKLIKQLKDGNYDVDPIISDPRNDNGNDKAQLNNFKKLHKEQNDLQNQLKNQYHILENSSQTKDSQILELKNENESLKSKIKKIENNQKLTMLSKESDSTNSKLLEGDQNNLREKYKTMKKVNYDLVQKNNTIKSQLEEIKEKVENQMKNNQMLQRANDLLNERVEQLEGEASSKEANGSEVLSQLDKIKTEQVEFKRKVSDSLLLSEENKILVEKNEMLNQSVTKLETKNNDLISKCRLIERESAYQIENLQGKIEEMTQINDNQFAEIVHLKNRLQESMNDELLKVKSKFMDELQIKNTSLNEKIITLNSIIEDLNGRLETSKLETGKQAKSIKEVSIVNNEIIELRKELEQKNLALAEFQITYDSLKKESQQNKNSKINKNLIYDVTQVYNSTSKKSNVKSIHDKSQGVYFKFIQDQHQDSKRSFIIIPRNSGERSKLISNERVDPDLTSVTNNYTSQMTQGTNPLEDTKNKTLKLVMNSPFNYISDVSLKDLDFRNESPGFQIIQTHSNNRYSAQASSDRILSGKRNANSYNSNLVQPRNQIDNIIDSQSEFPLSVRQEKESKDMILSGEFIPKTSGSQGEQVSANVDENDSHSARLKSSRIFYEESKGRNANATNDDDLIYSHSNLKKYDTDLNTKYTDSYNNQDTNQVAPKSGINLKYQKDVELQNAQEQIHSMKEQVEQEERQSGKRQKENDSDNRMIGNKASDRQQQQERDDLDVMGNEDQSESRIAMEKAEEEDKFTMSRMERFLKKLDKQLEESLR